MGLGLVSGQFWGLHEVGFGELAEVGLGLFSVGLRLVQGGFGMGLGWI